MNVGLGEINPIASYELGLTGAGVLVGVADTGIDTDHPEFLGRIHPQSMNFVNDGLGIEAVSGHGIAVAGIIAAAKNNLGIHGIAFSADILVLKVCGSDTTTSACGRPDLRLDEDNNTQTLMFVAAIDHAIAVGANVINVSLGFTDVDAPDALHTQLLGEALRRAVEAGILIVLAAGNDSLADPQVPIINIALEADLMNGILLVGAVDRNQALFSFSNRAGFGQDVFLVAPSGVTTTWLNGGLITNFGGTSAASPFVAGAAALLFELFPNLTGREVGEILLMTATDLGAVGVDSLFGHGLINLGLAIQPIGTQSIATQSNGVERLVPLDLTGLQSSLVFGDAFINAVSLQQIMMLDDFRRSYFVDLSDRVSLVQRAVPLLEGRARKSRFYKPLSFTLTGEDNLGFVLYERGQEFQHLADALPESQRAFQSYKLPQLSYQAFISDQTLLSVGYGLATSDLVVGNLTGDIQNSLLGFGFMGASELFGGRSGRGLGLSHRLSDSLTLSMASTIASTTVLADGLQAPDLGGQVYSTAVRVTKIFGDLAFSLETGAIFEKNSLLGSSSAGALSLGSNATTITGRFEASWHLSGKTRLVGLFDQGLSKIKGPTGSLVGGLSRLRFMGFGVALQRDDFLIRDGSLVLAVSSPLRIESGRATLNLPTGRDYGQDQILYSLTDLSLTPSDRELDFELSYRWTPAPYSSLEINLLHQLNAGHSAVTHNATSILLGFRRNF